MTDQVAWLPGNERVDVINCEYGQPDYEERINRRPVLDEDLIPEAIDAREASGRNSRIGHLWHTHVINTVQLVTCRFPTRLPRSVTRIGSFPDVLEQEVEFHQIIHQRYVRPEGNSYYEVPPRNSQLAVLAVDTLPTREQL